jgi:hypothetical protein
MGDELLDEPLPRTREEEMKENTEYRKEVGSSAEAA